MRISVIQCDVTKSVILGGWCLGLSGPKPYVPRSSPVFAGSRSSSMSGAAGGVSHGSVVSVVGNVPSCVPGGMDASREDLQIGVDDAGRYVVLVKQLVQCVRIVKATVANNALATGGASLVLGLVMGTPFKLQRGARTSSPRVRCGTLQRCWSGLWKATVESMCWGKSREPSLWQLCTRRRAISQQHASMQ